MIFRQWLTLNPEQIPMSMPLSERIEEYIQPGIKVLDIGCGCGRFYEFFASRGCVYYGIDINSSAIGIARKSHKKRCEFQVCNAEKTGFPGEFFDILVAQGTLACMDLEGRKKSIDEIKRIGKEGSILHLTELDLISDDTFYQAQKQKTGEYGTVTARADGSILDYATHHFSRKELLELLGEDLEILVEEHPLLTTRNGNQYPSHRMIVRKGRSRV